MIRESILRQPAGCQWMNAASKIRIGSRLSSLCISKPGLPHLIRPAGVGVKTYAAIADSEDTQGSAITSQPQSPEPKFLSGKDIREKFLSYYEAQGHKRLPSASLVPQDPTVMLTIAGMLQFKPIFLGQEKAKYPCATTTQKCIRTNDIENVGVTKRHHTFFEMLGNFSFGDYFKEKAVQMAWEVSTKVMGVPGDRIWVSVFETDDDAFKLWRDKVGVPGDRIQRLGEDDNFWSSGPTGPCGPCSELYYDFKPELGTKGASLDDDSRFVEFYNLVFMESNRLPDGSLEPLEKQNIDTGMGLERLAQILQGAQNNYETDLILPIVHKAASLASKDYQSASEKEKASLKVIADHARAVSYLISDGVSPSNVGRGYVLRRLLRRAVMKGRVLGIEKPFIAEVIDVVINLSHGCDQAVAQNAERIKSEASREESRFIVALEAGEQQLQEIVRRSAEKGTISGADAFLLYDTFGFPLEITIDAAAEKDIQVDIAGFEKEMARQKQRSKESAKTVDLEVGGVLAGLGSTLNATQFNGYTALENHGKVVALLREGKSVESVHSGEEVQVVLDTTPFYAESGGQLGDRGTLTSIASSQNNGAEPLKLHVTDVQKAAGGSLFVHTAKVEAGSLQVGEQVVATVDAPARKRAKANHTATHLLQAALKQVLPNDIAQQGSSVTLDGLRFDFNLDRPMKEEETREVENLVNFWIQEGHVLQTKELPIDEARAAGAVAMFGEKYGDVVRVVDVPGVSMELCGGTHVSNTSEIGVFKIKSEAGIASGIRRIEASAGAAAVDFLNQRDTIVRDLTAQLKSTPADLSQRVSGLQEEVSSLRKQLAEARTAAALAQARSLVSSASTIGPHKAQMLVARLDNIDAKAMQDAAQDLVSQLPDPGAVVLLGAPDSSKVSMVAAFSPKVVKAGIQAGKFIGGIAKICGGGGGGRPNMAQAGGKDTSKLDEALERARDQLQQALEEGKF